MKHERNVMIQKHFVRAFYVKVIAFLSMKSKYIIKLIRLKGL